MAATIPTALKQADIARFAQRAGQLEKAKPVVAYWCNYWIVNQILSKGLHNSDDESMTYTMHLMDKLEQSKADHRDNEAIVDDSAGQAYVDQFGTETLERAENAMKLNKATRQTADTFLASATFLELCQIWGPLDPAVASKIKYAKYHALRIAKAIKAGEDPNLSNPAPMEPLATVQPSSSQFESPQFQPTDDVKQEESDRVRSTAYQPFVEDVPDNPQLSEQYISQPLHLSGASSTPETKFQDPFREYHHPSTEGNSQLGHDDLIVTESAKASNALSDDASYFPRTPSSDEIEQPGSALQEISWDERGSAPPPNPSISSLANHSRTSTRSGPQPLPPRPAISLQSFPPPNMDRLSPPEKLTSPSTLNPTQSSYMSRHPPQPTQILPPHAPPSPQPTQILPPHAPPSPKPSKANFQPPPPSRHPTNPPQSYSQTAYLSDEEAILKAQKHARWAISALNFEDVNTAVKELKIALDSLGARELT